MAVLPRIGLDDNPKYRHEPSSRRAVVPEIRIRADSRIHQETNAEMAHVAKPHEALADRYAGTAERFTETDFLSSN
jgi:hypothetical protein